MCIFIYFGYAPPPNTGSVCVWNRILWNARKWTFRWLSSAPRRLELPRSIRPPQVPASPQEAAVWRPALPQLGGLILELRLGTRAGLFRVFSTAQRGLRMSGSWQSSEFHCPEGAAAGWACDPGGLPLGPFPCRRGTWEPRFLRRLYHGGGKETEALHLSLQREVVKSGKATTERAREQRWHMRPVCHVAAAHACWLCGRPPVCAV